MIPKKARNGCIVSCDIVSHSADAVERQYENIIAINDMVGQSILKDGGDSVIWASGGDGGHIAILGDDLIGSAVELATKFADWSDAKKVPLRTTIHYGRMVLLRGADGRDQLAGADINLCGSLVTFGVPGAVVVTASFRHYVERNRRRMTELTSLEFISERTVYLKHFQAHSLSLLQTTGGRPPRWTDVRSDHRLLMEASQRRRYWQMFYHCKRLLQANSDDEKARGQLDRLSPDRLVDQDGNLSVFGTLTRESIKGVVIESQLVERDDGDILCEKGDAGDTMFVILRGEVGVVTGRASAEHEAPTDIRYSEGGVVGELALGLHRNRTATLQAIGPTALLAIDYAASKRLTDTYPSVRQAMDRLINVRTLEHVHRNTDYLAEPANGSSDAEQEVESPWLHLEDGTELISYAPSDAQALSPNPEHRPELSKPGIYILAGGQLVEDSQSADARKTLSGDNFDLVYVNLAPDLVSVPHEYRLDPKGSRRRISILRIAPTSLRSFSKSAGYDALIERLARRLCKQMLFDVFVSYAQDDAERVQRWRDAFVEAGLKVYLNKPGNLMRDFDKEVSVAIAESRVFMPFVSRASSLSDWVARELNERADLFPDRHNILPVGNDEQLKQMVRGIDALTLGGHAQGDGVAIELAIARIKQARDEGPLNFGRKENTRGTKSSRTGVVRRPPSGGSATRRTRAKR